MNGVSEIEHKSRSVEPVFKFTADGETSWSFTAKGNGEIYADAKTNIASYTIEGSVQTLPYPIVNGQSYTVAITKTTPSQIAELSLFYRREDNEQEVINVPDFGAGNGRYGYFLLANNKVQKVDFSLMTSAYWDSINEEYTSAYIVDEITLPLPSFLDDTYDIYSFNQIVYDVTSGRHIICGLGGTSSANRLYYAFFAWLDENMNLESFDGTPNAYSEYFRMQSNIGSYYEVNKYAYSNNAFVDYVNNDLWYTPVTWNTGDSSMPTRIDLTDGMAYDTSSLYRSIRGHKCINPITNQIWSSGSLMNKDNTQSTFLGIIIRNQVFHDFDTGEAVYGGSDNGAYHVCRTDGSSGRGQEAVYYGNKVVALRHITGKALIVTGSSLALSNWQYSFFLKNISADLFNGHYMTSLVDNYTNMPSFLYTDFAAASNNTGLVAISTILGTNNGANRNLRSPLVSIIDGTKAFDLTASGTQDGIADVGYVVFEADVIHLSTNQIL